MNGGGGTAGAGPIEIACRESTNDRPGQSMAFDCDMHVLVILTDMTNDCDALREISSARKEVPGRARLSRLHIHRSVADLRVGRADQGPARLYHSDPDSEHAEDDKPHPIPDLTEYITDGQVLLSRSLHRNGRGAADRRAALADAEGSARATPARLIPRAHRLFVAECSTPFGITDYFGNNQPQ